MGEKFVEGMRLLTKLVWQYSKLYIILLIFQRVAITISSLINLWGPMYIIDSLTVSDEKNAITWIGIMLFTTALVKLINIQIDGKTEYLMYYIFNKFQMSMVRKSSNMPFERLENREYHEKKQKAYQFLYGGNQSFCALLGRGINLLGICFTLITIIITLLVKFDIFALLIFLGLSIVNSVVSAKNQKKAQELDIEKIPYDRRGQYMLEQFSNPRFNIEVRANGLGSWLSKKCEEQLDIVVDFSKKSISKKLTTKRFMVITAMVYSAISYYYILQFYFRGDMTIGEVSMYIAALTMFSSLLQEIFDTLTSMSRLNMYVDEAREIFDEDEDKQTRTYQTMPERIEKIEFRDVTFTYLNNQRPSVKNISFILTAGEQLTIVGENGAGKSTLIKLLCRLYEPTEGRIFINDIDIQEFDRQEYVKKFAVVLQEFELFAFSLADNIRLDRNTGVDVEQLLKDCKLDFDKKELPKGIDTMLFKVFDSEGVMPSMGEAQKIATARALYRDSEIFIFDEYNSSLDVETEYHIQQKINKQLDDKISIVITHRFGSCKDSDNIMLLDSGEIKEYGGHDELFNQGGRYHELYKIQQDKYRY